MSEEPEDLKPQPAEVYLQRISRDIRALLLEMRSIVGYARDAESEIPEKMRRFMMYFHDLHDMKNMWHEVGLEPPVEMKRELERCHDRFIHLIQDLYNPDAHGGFEKVRQEMAKREGNRYDHTKLLDAG